MPPIGVGCDHAVDQEGAWSMIITKEKGVRCDYCGCRVYVDIVLAEENGRRDKFACSECI